MSKTIKDLQSIKEQYRLNGLGRYSSKEAERLLNETEREILRCEEPSFEELREQIRNDPRTISIV